MKPRTRTIGQPLTRAELERERAASRAREAKRIAAMPVRESTAYTPRRFGSIDGLGRKPGKWYDDVYVPPMDVTEVLW